MSKKIKWIKVILFFVAIYLISSAVYIVKHIEFGVVPEVVEESFDTGKNILRVIMGLPKTYTTYEKVPKIYLLNAFIRMFSGMVCIGLTVRQTRIKIPQAERIWKDRKRNIFGLPWSFTEYSMSEDRLFIKRGIVNTKYDEVRLYRIRDNSLTKSFWQRILGTGTIHITSSDITLGNFDLCNVTQPESVNELLSTHVDEARRKNRVIAKEDMAVTEHDDETIENELDEDTNEQQ